MKKLFMAMVIIGIFALICLTAMAQTPVSLYEQEGITPVGSPLKGDGYLPLNGKFSGRPGADSATNWNYQYGAVMAWSGIYGDLGLGGDGWIYTTGTDGAIDVEADIEMFCATTMWNNNVYFHLGNLYTANESEKTAYVPSTLTSNNGQWIGITFFAPKTVLADGTIKDAMVGTIDGMGRPVGHRAGSKSTFDAKILLSWDNGAVYNPPHPDHTGTGLSATNWLINGGAPGAYNLWWKIQIIPDTDQADGNYGLDPVVTVSPAL
jgi:hypothetical protein